LVVAWWQRWTNLCQPESFIGPLKPRGPFYSYGPFHKKRKKWKTHTQIVYEKKNNVRLIISISCQSRVLCRVFVCIVHFCHCALLIVKCLSWVMSIGLFLSSLFTVYVSRFLFNVHKIFLVHCFVFWSCVHFFFKVGFFSLSVSFMTLVKCVQGLLSAVPCLKNCLLYKYPLFMSCVQFCCLVSIVFVLCLLFLSCVDCPISLVLCILSFVSYLLSIVLRQLFPVYFLCPLFQLCCTLVFCSLSCLYCHLFFIFRKLSCPLFIVLCLLYAVHDLCP